MYRVLYRKWRPQTFEEVYGQPHITATLKNELVSGRVAHAYLFTGSRGTGKTTCAKILSKAVNCLSPHDGDPCNECEICRGIDNGSVLDVIEIDAASNNGVDNIRDLRDEANFTPVKAKYRVYIIDEVHMLSTGAFNALLKILEEPPEHVIFILATTEVHKLPATILSRCQRFDFKRISPEDICARLQYVAEHENIVLDEDAAALIEGLANGTIDAIVTDHAPHTDWEKDREFELAPFGMTGLETSLSLVLTHLVRAGVIDYGRMVEAMAVAPREILRQEPVKIEAGSVADLTVIDPEAAWTVEVGDFCSKANNSGFIGAQLKGRATDTYVGGYATMEDGVVVEWAVSSACRIAE